MPSTKQRTHINKKIALAERLIAMYNHKMQNTLMDTDSLREAVQILQEIREDLMDTRYTGMPARFRVQQVDLFNEFSAVK